MRSESRRHVRPYPPNGLPRAEWLRWMADRVQDSDPNRAEYCRMLAEQAEGRAFAALPLIARMLDEG